MIAEDNLCICGDMSSSLWRDEMDKYIIEEEFFIFSIVLKGLTLNFQMLVFF